MYPQSKYKSQWSYNTQITNLKNFSKFLSFFSLYWNRNKFLPVLVKVCGLGNHTLMFAHYACVLLAPKWLTLPPKGERASIYQYHWWKANICVICIALKMFFCCGWLGQVCNFFFNQILLFGHSISSILNNTV